MVVALRVEIALHDILLVVSIVCACPTARGIGNLAQYFSGYKNAEKISLAVSNALGVKKTILIIGQKLKMLGSAGR